MSVSSARWAKIRVWSGALFRPRLGPLLAAIATVGALWAWAVFVFYPNAAEILPDDPLQAASFGFEAFATHQLAHVDTGSTPSLIVVGGSSMAEALIWPAEASARLSEAVGRKVPVVNLSTGGQPLLGSLLVLLDTPIAPGSVVAVHTNVGRLHGSIEEIPLYLKFSPVLFLDIAPLAALNPDAAPTRPLAQLTQDLSAWVPMMLRHQALARLRPEAQEALRAVFKRGSSSASCRAALGGGMTRPVTPDNALYEYNRPPLPMAEKRRIIETNAPHQADRLIRQADRTIALLRVMNDHVKSKGARLVLVHPPQAPSYRPHVASVAETYRRITHALEADGVGFIDYTGRVAVEEDDFFDYTHLRPEGRRRFSAVFLQDMAALMGAE